MAKRIIPTTDQQSGCEVSGEGSSGAVQLGGRGPHRLLALGTLRGLIVVLVPQVARAQSAADGFNPSANDFVLAIALQANGKILVGGDFTQIGGQPRDHIGRLNSNGTLDATFNPGANGDVFVVAVQPDGKILAGGTFSQLGGQSRDRIGRRHANGSPDATLNPGATNEGGGGIVTLAVQADGKILVGGIFSQLGGQPRDDIGRLNPDGTLDATFNPGANNAVDSFAVQADGKIVVGGGFFQLGGQPRDHIGRLNSNGTLDATFNPGADDAVFALNVQADGKIVVAGTFDQLGGQPRDFIGRLTNSDAALQNLSVNPIGTTITWLRSGASPEIDRVTFEFRPSLGKYLFLGNGTRIPGGWRLTGLSLPTNQNIFIRARGFYATGWDNGSGSTVESVRNDLCHSLPDDHHQPAVAASSHPRRTLQPNLHRQRRCRPLHLLSR